MFESHGLCSVYRLLVNYNVAGRFLSFIAKQPDRAGCFYTKINVHVIDLEISCRFLQEA